MVSLNKKFDEYFAKTPAVQITLQNMNMKNEDQISMWTQYVIIKVKPFTIEIQTVKFINFQKHHFIECSYKETQNIKNFSEVDAKYYSEAIKKAFLLIFDAFDLEYDLVIDRYQNIVKTISYKDDNMMYALVIVGSVDPVSENDEIFFTDGNIDEYGFWLYDYDL